VLRYRSSLSELACPALLSDIDSDILQQAIDIVLYYKSFDITDLAISCLLLFASARSPFDQQSFTVEDSSIEGDADSIDDPEY